MRIGLIARADKTGLAIQTESFYRNMHPEVTLVVDLSAYGLPEPDMALFSDRSIRWQGPFGPGPDFAVQFDRDPLIDHMLDNVDVVFTCETPYNYYLFSEAKRRGIKTVLQPNYEFLEYLSPTDLPRPDVFAIPSMWHWNEIVAALPGDDVRYVPVPVDTDVLHPSYSSAHGSSDFRILHTAGTVAQPNRNGTTTLFEAMRYLTDLPIRCTVLAQRNTVGEPPPNVDLIIGTMPHYWMAYEHEADIMVIPRRWGGLCLPMQEGLASGLPVIMPDCAPNDGVLPKEMLVDCYSAETMMTRAPLNLFDVHPQALAETILRYAGDPDLRLRMAEWADRWSMAHSWGAWRSAYRELLAPG